VLCCFFFFLRELFPEPLRTAVSTSTPHHIFRNCITMSQGRYSTGVVVAVLAAVCLLLMATVSAEPILVARKGLLNVQAIKDRELVVSIDVFNVGTSTAYDVTLQDASWFEPTTSGAFELVTGLASASWSSLPAYVGELELVVVVVLCRLLLCLCLLFGVLPSSDALPPGAYLTAVSIVGPPVCVRACVCVCVCVCVELPVSGGGAPRL
jgi:Translocon-associated protein beta (TRAPB)